MVGNEGGPDRGENDRRRFLVLATKIGLAIPPVVTLALARRSYAAGSGFKDPPGGGGGGGQIGGLGGGSSSGGTVHHNPPPRNIDFNQAFDHDHDHHRN